MKFSVSVFIVVCISLSGQTRATTLTAQQITFNLTGQPSTPIKMIPYTPNPGNWFTYTEFQDGWKQLLLDDGQNSILLDKAYISGETNILSMVDSERVIFWKTTASPPYNLKLYTNNTITTLQPTLMTVDGYFMGLGKDFFAYCGTNFSTLKIFSFKTMDYYELNMDLAPSYQIDYDFFRHVTAYENGIAFDYPLMRQWTDGQTTYGSDGLETFWVSIPEPATLLLLVLGAITLRKRKQ